MTVNRGPYRNHCHPSKDITGTDGRELEGKRIVLCITTSVAAYRAIDLARLLMRHGAEVFPVMSQSASLMVTPEMMKWASGNNVVCRLSGDLEHIELADYGASDLVIVYPCTANTISKAANGIDDTPVTSILSVAIGSKIPILIAPAMHEAMYSNATVERNITILKEIGVKFIGPVVSEGKAKVADPEQVVLTAIDEVFGKGSRLLSGMRVLVTAGSTVEFIDPIRVITNLSSGKMGNAIAREATKLGGEVTLVHGLASGHGGVVESGTRRPMSGETINVMTSAQMLDAVKSELKSKQYHIAILAAAVADFTPEQKSQSKIDTRAGSHSLKLVPTKKIVDEVKNWRKGTFLVAFKAEYAVPKAKLIEKAFAKLQECKADLVVANDLQAQPPGSDLNQVLVVDAKRNVIEIPADSKDKVAEKLFEIIAKALPQRRS